MLITLKISIDAIITMLNQLITMMKSSIKKKKTRWWEEIYGCFLPVWSHQCHELKINTSFCSHNFPLSIEPSLRTLPAIVCTISTRNAFRENITFVLYLCKNIRYDKYIYIYIKIIQSISNFSSTWLEREL